MANEFHGKTVSISFDQDVCTHAGQCVGNLPQVFQPGRDPWIDPDQAAASQILDVVQKCPSGALKAVVTSPLNEIDVAALGAFSQAVNDEPAMGNVSFQVETEWQGGTRSVSRTGPMTLSGDDYQREFSIAADEPTELLGTNTAANPQELLLSALNACMTVGYVANAAAMGVTLKKLTIRSSGSLDLRGFLGLDGTVNPGYNQIHYDVNIVGDCAEETIDRIHQAVRATSPNFHNMARAILMTSTINGRS